MALNVEDQSLSLEERATNFQTMRHIELVRNTLQRFVIELLQRGAAHDQSKLGRPEVETFTKYTPLLASMEYNSAAYKRCLAEMKPALDHHYRHNRHHTEHHQNGIMDMTLVDLLEMLCDWYAAGRQQPNGDLMRSLEINTARLNIPPALVQILHNTIVRHF